MQDGARTEQTFQSPMCPDDGRDAQAIPPPKEPDMAMIRVEPLEVRVRTC